MDLIVCDETERLEKALESAEGLVFDCDGTLLDTMPLYYETWKGSCEELGLNLPIDRFYAFAGVPVKDIFQILIDEQLGENEKKITADYCMEVKRKHMEEQEAKGELAGPINVVVDIVKRFHGKMPMAVASSGFRDHVLSGLERNGLLHMFDTVVTTCEEEVKNPKPAPDIFLVAAKRIGIDPTKCVGFEDGDPGMKGINDAGFIYASDVRLMHMYPRNVEKRELAKKQSSGSESAA